LTQRFAASYIFQRRATLAQLVEQSIRNRQVCGSSPQGGSTNFICRIAVSQLYGNFFYASIFDPPLPVIELLNGMPLLMISAQHSTLRYFLLNAFQANRTYTLSYLRDLAFPLHFANVENLFVMHDIWQKCSGD
jgi:hypothetical protein